MQLANQRSWPIVFIKIEVRLAVSAITMPLFVKILTPFPVALRQFDLGWYYAPIRGIARNRHGGSESAKGGGVGQRTAGQYTRRTKASGHSVQPDL